MNERLPVEGETDPKPYRLFRAKDGSAIGDPVEQFATLEDAKAYRRRGDWHYVLRVGSTKISD